MNKVKPFVDCESLDNFKAFKLSLDANNTSYYMYDDKENIVEGTPDIYWQQVVFIKDVKYIYSQGIMYNEKQDILVNGKTIKTINNQSILGDGNMLLQKDLDIPIVFINTLGQNLPKSKDDGKLKVQVSFRSTNDNFDCYGTIKVQGNSSTAYAKKNWNIVLFKDYDLTKKQKYNFRNWGKESKFTLKADWIDLSHARNIVGARLWGDIVKTRVESGELPERLIEAPNYGAIDGFVVKVYFNGIYFGRYDWNISKEPWMVNMDDESDNDAFLGTEDYNCGCFRSEWNGINDNGWTDELRDQTTETVKNQLNTFIRFVKNSSDEEFKEHFEEYADLTSFIDYYVFHYFICGLDAFGKNQFLLSYGGGKYFASSYDMDSTFGNYWDGKYFVSTTYRCFEDYETAKHNTSNVLYDKLIRNYPFEISTRYRELREGPLSLANVIYRFDEFDKYSSSELAAADYAETTGYGNFVSMPGQETNNVNQIKEYITARASYVDEKLYIIPPDELVILGEDTLIGLSGQYDVEYRPYNTTIFGHSWSITAGSEFATINAETGELTILEGANESTVTICVTASPNEYQETTASATKDIIVTYYRENPITALAIVGKDNVKGTEYKYVIEYTPSNTPEKDVEWSIINGSEYATLDNEGNLTIINGANNAAVTIQVQSLIETSLIVTKNITVTYQEGIVLPDGYTLRNYVASTQGGAQYIDLNLQLFKDVDSIGLNMKVNIIAPGADNHQQATLIGAMYEVSPYPGYTFRKNKDTYEQAGIFLGSYGSKFGTLGQDFTFNGSKSDISFSHEQTTTLFCGLKSDNTPQRYSEAKIYYMKIYKNEILVRDLVPCTDNNDIAGLYDLQNDIFYHSASETELIYG